MWSEAKSLDSGELKKQKNKPDIMLKRVPLVNLNGSSYAQITDLL
jgi:hypothetical protein